MSPSYDYLIIGSGMAGLTVGSLLAKSGQRVCLLEAHEYPGGCAHSFPMGKHTFCAAVHYIFSCGEGEPVYNFLKKLGLHETVTFNRLDPEGYDHFRCPSARLHFRIPNGLDKWAERLIDRYPRERSGIAEFFATIGRLVGELRKMPFRMGWSDFLRGPLRFPNILRLRRWTLQRLFDSLRLSCAVQAILATQVGDLGLPPREVSLVAFAALIWSYSCGAYHPRRHFKQFVEAIAEVIRQAPGCRVEYQAEVAAIEVRGRRVEAVRTVDGRTFSGRAVICNMDPRACVDLIGRQHFPRAFRKQTEYDYSVGAYTIYLGVKGLDLRDHGFGKWNVWHYPHVDINAAYQAQVAEHDLSDPWLFLSTPTLSCDCPADECVCPPGEQILEAVTVCSFDHFQQLRASDPRAYHRRKQQVTDRILEILERDYVPGLRQHISLKVSGSPTTNLRYLWAPRGNIYGSALSPANVDFSRLKFSTPFENLYFTGASAEFPSIGATVVGGSRLYTHLTGDPVNPGRDLYGLW
jgi:phytoene dehydrogenase-like protein